VTFSCKPFYRPPALACIRAEEKRDARILVLQQENPVDVEAIQTNYQTRANFVRQIQGIAFSLDQTKDEKMRTNGRYLWMDLMKNDTLDACHKLVPSVEKLHKQSVKQQRGAFCTKPSTNSHAR
jgi:hypothetical protein